MIRRIIKNHKIGWPEMDSLTNEQFLINNIVMELDNVAVRYEKIWGVDRLPMLAGKEYYDKWQSQCQKLDDAIGQGHLPLVQDLAQGCVRGYALLDAKAREAGHLPHDAPMAWTCAMPSGATLAIVGSNEEAAIWQARYTPDENVYIWTIQEIANVIDSDHVLINQIFRREREKVPEMKEAIPFDFDKGDEIPEF